VIQRAVILVSRFSVFILNHTPPATTNRHRFATDPSRRPVCPPNVQQRLHPPAHIHPLTSKTRSHPPAYIQDPLTSTRLHPRPAHIPSNHSEQPPCGRNPQPRRKTGNIPCYGFPARYSRQSGAWSEGDAVSHQRARRERRFFGPEDSSKHRHQVHPGTAAGTPTCRVDERRACPLARLAEREEATPRGRSHREGGGCQGAESGKI